MSPEGVAAAPVLTTGRLRLRAHRREDLDELAAMWGDPAVTRHIGPPFSREECWSRLLRARGHWAVLGFGYWAVEERDGRRFVGEVGFAELERGIAALDGVPECGWTLARWSHGRGYATEAVRAVLAWGDARLDVPHTACIIAPANEASLRVAAKCGYEQVGRTTYHGAPTLLLTRPRGRGTP